MSCTISHGTLAQFFGSENLFFNPLFKAIKYTDGVQYLGAHGAGWLQTDILAHLTSNPKVWNEEFVAITINVDLKERSAVLTFTDGNDKILIHQFYKFVDLAVQEIKFFCTDGVLMLASEY